MKDEYIRREDAVDALKAQADTMRTWVERYAEQRRGILTAVNIVEDIKPADVVPVVYGRWIKYTGMGKVQWMCSECSAEEKNPKVANYCYHCGAKMRGEQE